MSKDKISDYSATANSNTDIGGINIDEGCAPSGINDAIRTLMKQLKDWQSGSQDVYIHPAGSASVPSITATGDTNTGLFFPAADTIALTTGGTERARVDSSGNLGLGGTPSAKLDVVAANFSGGPAIGVRYNTSNARMGFNIANANGFPYMGYNTNNANGSDTPTYDLSQAATQLRMDNGQFRFNIAASGTAGNAITFTQAMTLNASGYLGIGTTSPSSFLHVQTGSSSYPGAILRGAGDDQGWLKFGNQSGDYYSIKAGVDYGGMLFITGGSERARIDTSGNFLVGGTSMVSSGKALIQWTSAAGVDGLILYDTDSTNVGRFAQKFNRNGSIVGSIQTTLTATFYVTSSDYRLKENVQPMTGALAKIAALKPCTYTWKSTGEAGEGFIAHELAEVVPDAVTGEKDAVDEDGNPKYQGIDTSFLVATLTAAIQELNAKFEAYKATHP